MERGTRLGPYEVQEQLGAGGMGEVYLARDTRLGRKVAIKVLPAQFASDAERLARFEQEARAAAALNHPHIAVVHDIGHEDGTHYIVQEYLEGESLAEAVARGALPEKKALALGEQIARALAVAHAAGIVHRDLKPANVFVTPDGSAKVLDFGLAKLIDAGAAAGGTDASLSPTAMGTMAGTVMGTAGYMAPEQVNGEEVDRRADLFAFGCVLYEMITGQRAFSGQSIPDTLAKVLHSDPELIEAPATVAPAELDRILRKCLMKERAARYQYADDLAVDLATLQTAPTRPAEDRRAEAGDRSRGLPPGLVAALLLITAVGTFVASQAMQPVVAEPPVRTFKIDFPAERPYLLPCCSTNLVISRNDEFVGLFSAGEGGFEETGLSIRRPDSPEFMRLGDFGGYNLDISPDGEWVVYNELRVGGNREVRLRKVALAGGAPFDLGVSGIASPSWADDGYIYLAGGAYPRRVPEDGGELEVLEPARPVAFTRVDQVFAIPGGQVLLLGVGEDSVLAPDSIAAMSLATREIVGLVGEGDDPRWSPTGHLLWTREGAIYAAAFDVDAMELVGEPALVLQGVAEGLWGLANYSLSDAGTLVWVPGSASNMDRFRLRLSWIDREGTVTSISDAEEWFTSPRAAFGGNHVATTISDDGGSDVWLLDVAQSALVRLTSDGISDAPVWSRDDTWVYFTRGSGASGDIWRRRADFSALAEPVLERPLRQVGGDVSPDGSFLIFEEWHDGFGRAVRDLWLLPLDTGDPVPLVQSPDMDWEARFSPDGNLVAYQSNESGRSRIYVREIDGGRRAVASPGDKSASSASWSQDGHLYYQTSDGLFEVEIEAGADGLRVSPPELVQTLPRNLMISDVRPDGTFLSVQRVESARSGPRSPAEIMMTLNWFPELRRLAPRDP